MVLLRNGFTRHEFVTNRDSAWRQPKFHLAKQRRRLVQNWIRILGRTTRFVQLFAHPDPRTSPIVEQSIGEVWIRKFSLKNDLKVHKRIQCQGTWRCATFTRHKSPRLQKGILHWELRLRFASRIRNEHTLYPNAEQSYNIIGQSGLREVVASD